MQHLQQKFQDLIDDKYKMQGLALNLLGCRRPPPLYPIFLWEKFYFFQLNFFYENRPYLGNSTRTFLDVFCACDFDEKNLLCEIFLHNMIFEYASLHMIVRILSYMRELQLCAFISFIRNQVEWHLAMKSSHTNEEKVALWIRAEPGMATSTLR